MTVDTAAFRTYRADKVRRVYNQKANGKLRPLEIPTGRDRVVQTATQLILEPIFEADFNDCSHGLRPGARYVRCCSGAAGESLCHGRLTAWLRDITPPKEPTFFCLCGSPELVVDVRDILSARHYDCNDPVGDLFLTLGVNRILNANGCE